MPTQPASARHAAPEATIAHLERVLVVSLLPLLCVRGVASPVFDASIDAYIVFGNWVSRGWVGSRSAMWAEGGARELSCGLN